jgi:hypothetical protein
VDAGHSKTTQVTLIAAQLPLIMRKKDSQTTVSFHNQNMYMYDNILVHDTAEPEIQDSVLGTYQAVTVACG